jgi:hypothetical protein
MNPGIYKAMAEPGVTTAYQEGWRHKMIGEPAPNIKQLARPDGEGAETFKEANGEVDHMRDTGSFITYTCDKTNATAIKDLEGCAHQSTRNG